MTIFFIAPHLSTGGMPQYLYKQIEALHKKHSIYCLEWDDITGGNLVVQRNKIKNILGKRLVTLDQDKHHLFKLIEEYNPDIIHLQEIPEMFMPSDIADKFYSINRTYKIIETSHDSSFDINRKIYFPDKFMMVSQYQVETYKPLNIPIQLVEYPIEYKTKTYTRQELLNKLGLDPNKKHVINVGLFTPRKNQAEVIEYARMLKDYPIQFHFIGNQADNFQDYWQPLMKEFPSNCKWWGERDDVDTFFEMADLFLFTSRGHATDKETMPLVIREAISWKTPSLIFNLDVYLNYFNKFSNINYLDFNNKEQNIKLILNKLGMQENKIDEIFDISINPSENKIHITYKKHEPSKYKVSIKEKDSNAPMYWFNAEFVNGSAWWIVPIPVQSLDFVRDPVVGTLVIEFYNLENELLYSKDLFIKETVKKDVALNLNNPFDCLFNNYNEMFLSKKYDCYELDNLDTVFDIGANSGLFSLLCANKGVKKIYAFEPNQDSLINLKSVTQNLDIEILDKAVYTKDEDLKFYIDPTNTTIGSLSKEHLEIHSNSLEEIVVPAISLKTFIKQNNIDRVSLVKMDIEGAEYEIIEELEDEVFDVIDGFLIEFHDNQNKKVSKLVNKLSSKGFEIDQIRDQNSLNNDSIKHRYEDSVIGTIYAKRKAKQNPIVIIDAFFHNDHCLSTFKESILNIKKLGLPIMVVTNSDFDKSIIDSIDYLVYDKNNRLFEKEYNTNDLIGLWYGDAEKYFCFSNKASQKHGLSVLSNLYHTTNLAKSLGYTKFIRIEYDSIIKNIENINNLIIETEEKNKKGFIYVNEEKYLSFQLWYFDLDYFTKIMPKINTEKDYINTKFYLNSKHNDFILVEDFLLRIIKKKGLEDIIVKTPEDLEREFPKTYWNSVTSPAESDSIIDGFFSSVFKVSDNKKYEDERNAEVNNNLFAIVTWNCSSSKENISKITINKNGKKETFYQKVLGDNSHDYKIFDLDSEDIEIEISMNDKNSKSYIVNKNNIESLNNIFVLR